jgi:hypothetical protein
LASGKGSLAASLHGGCHHGVYVLERETTKKDKEPESKEGLVLLF